MDHVINGLCPPDTVLFDFGGVLAEEGFFKGLTAIAEQAGRDPATVVPVAYEMAWSTGFVVGGCDEAGFWQAFREATGIAGDDAALTEMVLSRFTPRPFMFAIVDAARAAGMKTAILSDQTTWLPRLDAKYDVFSHFDAVFNSYDHGVTKRDAAFFELALDHLGSAPAASIFIDDAPRNVDLAASLGLRAILYTDKVAFLRDLAAVCPLFGALHV
ncbi:HAD family phosphatase [Desulfovibrio sp. JY]|nr:HAD family phosphatase [Desulfovibrio sp. JY]